MFPFYRERSHAAPQRQSFPYPLKPCPPIAVLPPYFAPVELPLAQARTIAAPLSTIRRIDPGIWMPGYPIVVFSDLETGLVSEEDRDYVWKTFGVPMFEYLLDASGRIAARECEAHEGLHIEDAPSGWRIQEIPDPCACGRPGQRLSGWRDALQVLAGSPLFPDGQ